MTHPSPGSWGTGRGRTRGNRGGYPHFNNERGYNHSNVRNYNQNNDRGYNQHNDRGYNQNNDVTWNNQAHRYSDINQVYVTQGTRGRHVPNSHPGHLLPYVGPQDNRPIPVPVMFQPTVDMSVPPPMYPHNGMQMFHYPMIPNNPEPGQFIPTNEPVMPEIHHIPSHSIQQNVPIEVQYRPLESSDTGVIEKACSCEKCHFMNLNAYIIINNLIAEKKYIEDLLKSSQYKHQEGLESKDDSVQNGAQYSHAEEPSFQLSANAAPFVNDEYIPTESWSSGMDHQEKKSVNWKSDLVSVDTFDRPYDASISSECEVVEPPVVSWADEEEADGEMSGREGVYEPDIEQLAIADQTQVGRPRSGGDGYRDRPRGNYNAGGSWQGGGGGRNYEQQGGGRPGQYGSQGYSHGNHNQRDGPPQRGGFQERGGGRKQNQGRGNDVNWRQKGDSRPEEGVARGQEAEQAAGQSSNGRSNDNQRGGAVGSVLTEINGDLFTADADVSLAHCVAVDLRMGSGIAVEFRSRFGRLGELFDQYKGVGEVAILADKNRFLYYLITKELSRGKPTMDSLRRSLEVMCRHCVKHEVSKVAMPRIGCGLDRLDWPRVRALLEEVFAGAGVHITVYNFPQVDEDKEPDQAQKKKSSLYITHHKLDLVNIEAKTGLLYFCSEETVENRITRALDGKHRFLQLVRGAKRELGGVVRTERGQEVLYGLVVKKREKDRISFAAMVDCFRTLRKMNNADGFEYLGLEAFRDPKDRFVMEKVVTVVKNMLVINKTKLEVWFCWPKDAEDEHDWLDAQTGAVAK